MNGEALINVCQAAMHGSDRFVRHFRDQRVGKVVRCSNGGLVVEVGAEKEVWNFADCEELVPSPFLRTG